MIAELRGALGTQVLGLLQWCSIHDWPPDAIRINTRNVHTFSRTDYVSQIFDGLPPVSIVDAARKIKFSLAATKEIIRRRAQFPYALKPNDAPSVDAVLHVRLGDRSPTAISTYARHVDMLKKLGDVRLIGSHPATLRLLAERHDLDYQEQSAVDDWHLARRARVVVGPVSTFTLSALAFSETRQNVTFLPQDGAIPATNSAEDKRILRYLDQVCDGLSVIDA